MKKYSDARYPEKINDLINNDGELSEEGKEIIGNSIIPNALDSYIDVTEVVLEKEEWGYKWSKELVFNSERDGKELVEKWFKIGQDILTTGKIKINFQDGQWLDTRYLNIAGIMDYRDEVESDLHQHIWDYKACFGYYAGGDTTLGDLLEFTCSGGENLETGSSGINVSFRLHRIDPNG